jgi:putative glutamine amidotransferase
MHRPQIGIPLTLDDRGRWREGRTYHYIDRSYATAIDRAGGIPLQLPIQSDPRGVVEALDGLLIPGGDDFPADRALPSDAQLDVVPAEQLAFDEALVEAASARNIPIFGICYGMQLIARLRNGVLDAHLATDRPEADCHRLPPDDRHPIQIEATSRLAGILGCEEVSVNSLHHQAVRCVGPMHSIVATSPDGVIEAIERAQVAHGDAWEIGVQWHPEKMQDDASERLFSAFVAACDSTGRSA